MGKRHLAVLTKAHTLKRVACRIAPTGLDMTTRPSEVTCNDCKHSVDLADQEIKTNIGHDPKRAGQR